MAEKVVRGQKLVFRSTPTDEDGNSIAPSTMKLYLNYIHSDGTRSTDSAIDMTQTTGGVFEAEFDTRVCKAGLASAHVRSTNPAGGEDIKFTITAELANPDP